MTQPKLSFENLFIAVTENIIFPTVFARYKMVLLFYTYYYVPNKTGNTSSFCLKTSLSKLSGAKDKSFVFLTKLLHRDWMEF